MDHAEADANLWEASNARLLQPLTTVEGGAIAVYALLWVVLVFHRTYTTPNNDDPYIIMGHRNPRPDCRTFRKAPRAVVQMIGMPREARDVFVLTMPLVGDARVTRG